MAFTQSDIDALDRAISSGELRIMSNGREVIYRNIDELLRAREYAAQQVAAATARHYPRHQLADFSDE